MHTSPAAPAARSPRTATDCRVLPFLIGLLAASAAPAQRYELTEYPVPGGVYTSRLTPSGDGRHLSWCDAYARDYRVLDLRDGSSHTIVLPHPHKGAGNLGGLADVGDGFLYARCYRNDACTRRATWRVDPVDWSAALHVGDGWLLGLAADGREIVAWEIEGFVHGHVDVVANETWQHGYYRPEFGGGLAAFRGWGNQAFEYDPMTGAVAALPFAGQPVTSAGGTLCRAAGPQWLRLAGEAAWTQGPMTLGYCYGVSDGGVGVGVLSGVLTSAAVDVASGEILLSVKAVRWGHGIGADGTVYLGAYDRMERYTRGTTGK